MNEDTQLTLEQKFSLRSFETQVDKMSREQAQEFLVKLYEQMMMRETMYKKFLKHEWGIDSAA
ncbi:MAG: NblA/ycf18 family protein [Leptolyngbyaceae cyanobacterium]